MGKSSDAEIMHYMFSEGKPWAYEEQQRFFDLSLKYYHVTKKTGIFCDIGANIGTTCIYFKKNIDPSIKILAFEPVYENYNLLHINMMLNDIDEEEATLVNMGVADAKGECVINLNEENPGASSFLKCDEAGQKVSVIPFEDYLSENSIDAKEIKYIWVDVEGFEGAFVKGAQNVLKEINVPIMMEFTPLYLLQAGTFEQFINILSDIYSSYIIIQENTETDILHPIESLWEYKDYPSFYYQFDIFLIK